MTDTTAVLTCEGVRKTFPGVHEPLTVLERVDLTVQPGDRIAVVGASGAGKSTLLHVLGGLDTPTSGQVLIQGRDMARLSNAARGRLRNRSLGFIYQFHHLLPEFTTLQNVAMPLLIRRSGQTEAFDAARELLEEVGLGARLEHKPTELSGGERQRAAVARALVTRPDCILADEPTGNLDHRTAMGVFDRMLARNASLGTSLVLVTHDRELARRMDDVRTLENGCLVHTEPVQLAHG